MYAVTVTRTFAQACCFPRDTRKQREDIAPKMMMMMMKAIIIIIIIIIIGQYQYKNIDFELLTGINNNYKHCIGEQGNC
jgi:lauroyl/myristoyl acyltransferase